MIYYDMDEWEHKASNDIIQSVKCSELWTDSAVIFSEAACDSGPEKDISVTYVLIPSDTCEHV